MRKTGALTTVDVVADLVKRSWINLDGKNVDKLCLEYNIQRQIRQNMANFWADAQKNLGVMQQHPILSSMGLQSNHSSKFLGSTDCATIRRVFHVDLRTSNKILVVPYNDLPGRISSFRFYYMKGTQLLSHDALVPCSQERGLFMLDSVRPATDMVIAVDDPLFAFQVQNHSMLAGMTPRAIVAYSSCDTNWNAVIADKVIFWTQELTLSLFKAIRRVHGGMISVAPDAVDRVKFMRRSSICEWTSDILARSVPWVPAFSAWIRSVNRDEAVFALREMEITSTQQRELIDSITNSDERVMVKELVEATRKARSVIHRGSEVSERDDCWYCTVPGSRTERLVSDVVIRLTGTIKITGEGNYYTGFIVRNGVQKRFYASTELADRECKKWVEDFCIENDMGFPEIAQSWGPRLLSLARAFSGELETGQQCGKVGWSQDLGAFVLPKRVVRDGRIEIEGGVPVPSYPCQRVTGSSLTGTLLAQLLEDTKANAQFWALFACSMMNAAAPFFGIRKKKIGAVGQSNFASAFANSMDFCTVRVTRMDYDKHPSIHDVPLHMSLEHIKLRCAAKWLNDAEEKNVLISLNYLEAMQMADEDWIFVHTEDFSKLIGIQGAYDLIPHAMQFVQTCGHRITTFTPDIFLKGFRDHLQRRFLQGRAVNFSVMEHAGALISHQSPLGTTAAQAFLYAVFMLLQSGAVQQGRSDSGSAIVVNDHHVDIPRSVINQVVLDGCSKRAAASLSAEVKSFDPSFARWRVSRKYWDETFTRFQKERIF